ncbi:MAG: hypothetical protein H6624_18710 [Bdellovibrionaceae bacterium]|nr:hypothetical protein [Bdellovibrionales bacterium]MCB9086378.1 hypothetical protein [Pseudobdellovibrionaceae bacterium]
MKKFVWIGLAACMGLAGTAGASESVLRKGNPVMGPVQQSCSGNFVEDSVAAFCALFPGNFCSFTRRDCRSYKRQLFTGTKIGPSPNNNPNDWNGMGGSGEIMADALLCTLRQTHPMGAGTIHKDVDVNIGLGTVKVRHSFEFKSFDHQTQRFEGQRRVYFEMPVLGSLEAITQNIVVEKRTYGLAGLPQSAGNRPIYSAYALDVSSQEKNKHLEIIPPAIPVHTPIGTFSAQPKFVFMNNSIVSDGPFNGGAVDIPQFLGGNTVRLFDMWGVDEGVIRSAKKVTPANHVSLRNGWNSQIGIGSRGRLVGGEVWQPGSGPLLDRPDLDLTRPRSSEEGTPSLYARAEAKVTFPTNPWDILPSWVANIPFLRPPIIQVSLTPLVEAGMGGELLMFGSEGSDLREHQEFRITPYRAANAGLAMNATAEASFRIDAGFRFKLEVGLPWPVGDKTLVDINKTIPIPITGDRAQSPQTMATIWSTGGEYPESLDLWQSLKGDHVGPVQTGQALKACLSVPSQQVTPSKAKEPELGDPADLFKADLWHCNICVVTEKADYYGDDPNHPDPVHIPSYKAVLLPAVQPPSYNCAFTYKSGCFELCKFDKETGKLNRVRTVQQIASGMPADHPDKKFMEQCSYDPPH